MRFGVTNAMNDGRPLPRVIVRVVESGSLVPGSVYNLSASLDAKFWFDRGYAKEGGAFARIVRENELVIDFEPSLAVTLTDCVPASPSLGVKVNVLVAELNAMIFAYVPLGLKVIVTG